MSKITQLQQYMDRLLQRRRNASALALELRLSYINPSIYKVRAACYIFKTRPRFYQDVSHTSI